MSPFLIDAGRPGSWSRQMVALVQAGHYREGYEILAEKMSFVDRKHREYVQHLAGTENYLTRTLAWIERLADRTGPQRILDVGCGVGPLAIEFARMGHRTWGIDILPAMIERGNELIESLELSERAHLVEGDIRRLERYFDGHFFDTALACDIFEHLDDASLMEVLAGLRHVVRPGGRVVIQMSPGRYYYWFDSIRWKLLALLVPFAWLPDRLFSTYVRALELSAFRRLRHDHVRFYRHEYGHINCMDPTHLRRLLKRAGLVDVRTFAVHAHRGFKDEGCLRSRWTARLFQNKTAACRNVFGIARIPGA